MSTIPLETLRANQRFMISELLYRGVAVELIDYNNEVFEATLGSHRELLFDINSSLMSYATSVIASSKKLTRYFFDRAGLSIPHGACFGSTEISAVTDYCLCTHGPFVIKPALGVQGELVQIGIEQPEEIAFACDAISQERGPTEIIVEQMVFGHEYRVFYTKNRDYAVLRRDPAHVIGDGLHTIIELAAIESARRMNPRRNCLCEIVLDHEAQRFLRKRGLSLEYVPPAGDKVFVRGNSNVKTGGTCEDVTDIVHPSVLDIAQRVLDAIPALPYGGIDLMTADITQPLENSNYWIIEVNSVPGLGIHMAPSSGRPRNVAAMVADLIFPETMPDSMRGAA